MMDTKTRLTIAGAVLGTVVVVPALAWGASTLVTTPVSHTTTVTQADAGTAATPKAGSSTTTVTTTSSPAQNPAGAAPVEPGQPQTALRAGAPVRPATDPTPTDTADPTPTDPTPTPPRQPNVAIPPGPGKPPAWPVLTCDPSDTPDKPETLTNCRDDDGNPYEWIDGAWRPAGQQQPPSTSPTS